jgi:hypothetical protein
MPNASMVAGDVHDPRYPYSSASEITQRPQTTMPDTSTEIIPEADISAEATQRPLTDVKSTDGSSGASIASKGKNAPQGPRGAAKKGKTFNKSVTDTERRSNATSQRPTASLGMNASSYVPIPTNGSKGPQRPHTAMLDDDKAPDPVTVTDEEE